MGDPLRQYGSAKQYTERLTVKIPNASSTFDQTRLRTYTLYEDFYCNFPDSFKVILRGEDNTQQQIYVPSAEKIVEAICRFHAVDPTFELSEKDETTQLLMEDLWDREAFVTKHEQNKRWGCIRGDSAFYITADETKEPGRRISIHDLDPSCVFPIENPLVTGQLLGVHIVDEVPHPNGKKGETAARRQTYMRENLPDPLQASGIRFTGKITYASTIFETGKWDSRTLEAKDIKKLKDLVPIKYMPDAIKSLPVYWIPNSPLQNSFYGRSELAGIETIIAAINQTMTDEDITLAMKGLGVYATDADTPRDAANKPTDWEIGPGRVLEIQQGRKFENVAGVATVQPMQDHINAADEQAQQGKGVPEVAIGKVDVQIAESGISLRLQLGPILSKGQEKERRRSAIENQMWYDLLHQWFPAFEQHTPAETLRCRMIYNDPVPKNNEKLFELHVQIYELGVYPFEKFAAALNSMNLGFDLDAADFEKALDERKKRAEAEAPEDPFAKQMADEAGNIRNGQNNGASVGITT